MIEASESFTKKHKALELAQCFRTEFIARGYGFKIYSLKEVEHGRWWKFFTDTIDFYGEHKDWDAHLYVRSVFDKYGKTYPHILPRTTSWKNYLEYLPSYKENKDEFKNDVKALIADYKKMIRMMEEKNIETFDDFFKNAYVVEIIRRGNFSGNLFMFMVSYYRNYNGIYKISESPRDTFDGFKIRRLKFLQNEKIVEFLKKILKEEMI